ncbi:MAG: methylmalonyl-CoA mutase family protein, partial [Acidimicrobiia bacterium]|nr:methylmalonyl-CoA mutase family protein [Acidimicrobiia bacterium]
AAALGGAQSLGVSGYDEAMSIPSDHAHLMSIRTQQILQEETNLAAVADPLGGSFYVESLTHELETRALGFLDDIEARGGFVATIKDGWLMNQALESQLTYQQEIEKGDRRIVGVNSHHVEDTLSDVEGFEGRSGEETWKRAMERLTELRRSRDEAAANRSLDALRRVLDGDDSIVPAVMEAVQADSTIGEIGDAFRQVLGNWNPPVSF